MSAFMVIVSQTSYLVGYLRKNRTGFKRTDLLLNTLILYSVNTGICTGIVVLVSTVLFACSRSLLFFPIGCVIAPVHTICVLAACVALFASCSVRE
ncbi:hypothetical protein C8Q74DRAFT_749374 [Fomes fomentarius]|nr:hypothetical protein C8Q74DRAFT_749374 [Fomes fomentarius]